MFGYRFDNLADMFFDRLRRDAVFEIVLLLLLAAARGFGAILHIAGDGALARIERGESLFWRERYAEASAAFAAALRSLSARERTLLRLHLLDGLTEEQIGNLYSAHRVTIARWLRRTRRQILSETQRLLAERLGLPQGELESVTGLVPSRLDLSLSSLLRSG